LDSIQGFSSRDIEKAKLERKHKAILVDPEKGLYSYSHQQSHYGEVFLGPDREASRVNQQTKWLIQSEIHDVLHLPYPRIKSY